MAKCLKVTPKNLDSVLAKYMDYIKDDKDARKEFSAVLDTYFDDLLNNDCFGTEGQCDPRGDHRDCCGVD